MKYSQVNSFEEALQRILFFNQILWQTGHGLNGFGRLDKVLNDIYQEDSISKTETLNLIKDFLKAGHSYFYYKSTALPGDTGQIIVLGGKEPDNSYFANDLTYLFLQAVKELNLPDPKIILRYADNVPRKLMELGLECMVTGVGSPLISNDELVIDYLMDFGYEKEFAHNYVVSACWEPAPIAKGLELNNLNTLVFLNPLNKLLDNEDLTKLETFDLLLEKYKKYLRKYSNDLIDEINKREWETDPLLSLFIDDCDKNFIDVSKGGAYYNNFGFTSVSLSNTVDSLINIKKLVYEDKDFTLEELNNHRLNNFEDEHVLEILKNQKVKFGMDDETLIELSKEIMDTVQEIFSTKSTKYGGKFKFGLSSPAYLSSAPDIKASLDGRRDFEAFDVHISLDENQDYTELMRFASKLDYSGCKFNGNVVDLWFPQISSLKTLKSSSISSY
ncbi:MAG: pyruvate formate lyase family protein [Methanobrevibacter sp.]|nr:pyruvate formate lyase family protein [Methanobrevibacter sp.]